MTKKQKLGLNKSLRHTQYSQIAKKGKSMISLAMTLTTLDTVEAMPTSLASFLISSAVGFPISLEATDLLKGLEVQKVIR